MSLNRRQAILWTNDGIVYWCIYTSLGLNELNEYDYVIVSVLISYLYLILSSFDLNIFLLVDAGWDIWIWLRVPGCQQPWGDHPPDGACVHVPGDGCEGTYGRPLCWAGCKYKSLILSIYCQTYNMRQTLVGNKLVDHSYVVGASPVGAASTTSSFST